MRKEYVAIKITHLLNERDWTLCRLAKESGVQITNLKEICFRGRIPTIPTIIKICNGFGITLSEFFDEGNTTINQLMVSDQQLIGYFHAMTSADKNRVADYVHILSNRSGAVEQSQISENTVNQTPCFTDKTAASMMADD